LLGLSHIARARFFIPPSHHRHALQPTIYRGELGRWKCKLAHRSTWTRGAPQLQRRYLEGAYLPVCIGLRIVDLYLQHRKAPIKDRLVLLRFVEPATWQTNLLDFRLPS
jgi:hypothetical protein